MGVQSKKRAWRGQPARFQLVCLFVPDFISENRLDGRFCFGEAGRVLGASGKRALERLLAMDQTDITPRQWRSQAALLTRLTRELPNTVNPAFAAWLRQGLEDGPGTRLFPPQLSWDVIRLARPDSVSETERTLVDHWALLQRNGYLLLKNLNLEDRLSAGDGPGAMRDLIAGIRSNTLLTPYWNEAALQHVETTGTVAALDRARISAFVQALVSQLGLVQALHHGAHTSIAAMVELNLKRGRCNPGGVLLRELRDALALPTVESLVEELQIAGGGPDRSTLMAWSSGARFPSGKLWLAMMRALQSASDPDFKHMPALLKDGTIGWAARRINGVLQTFGPHWHELQPFLGEAQSLHAWVGPSVERWRLHWGQEPLPHVESPSLPVTLS